VSSWERGWWRKLFVREPSDQEIWPWQARGLRDLLIRIADDDGRVGRDGEALRRRLRAGAELDEHVQVLLDDGFLVQNDGGLYVRNLEAVQGSEPERRSQAPRREPNAKSGGRWAGTTPEQRSEAARRAADRRWGRDASTHPSDASSDASSSHPLTHGDACDDASSDASSPRAVSGQDLPSESLRNQREREEQTDQKEKQSDACDDASSDASTHDASTHRRTTDPLSLDYVTECPENLPELCRARGLTAGLAKSYGVSVADVHRAISDYRDHFTTGGGFGEKRYNWGKCVRSKVLALHRASALAGIGASESRPEPRRPPPRIENERKPVKAGIVPDFVNEALAPKAAGGPADA
jgi:hypothetical protein